MNPLALEQQLAALGFYKGKLDGLQGPMLIQAIRDYQASKGLKIDGVVGKATLDAMGGPALHAISGIPTNITTDCVDLVKAFEGLADGNPHTVLLEPDPDPVGIYSVGWGHALTNPDGSFCRTSASASAAMLRLFGASAITVDQAKSLLSVDLNTFIGQVAPLLSGAPCDQSQFDALISFSYNVGARALGGSTLLARHKAGVPARITVPFSALEQDSKAHRMGNGIEDAFAAYSYSAGKWFLGIFRRRMAEALVYGGQDASGAIPTAQGIH